MKNAALDCVRSSARVGRLGLPLLLTVACNGMTTRSAGIRDDEWPPPTSRGASSADAAARGNGAFAVPSPDAGVATPAVLAEESDSGALHSCSAAEHGAEEWRHDFGDVNVLSFTSVVTGGAGDVFVASALRGTTKLDDAGNVVWSRPFGSIVAMGSNGHPYVAGTFDATSTALPCALTAAGQRDVYYAELDDAGNVVRCVGIGGPEGAGIGR